MALVLLVIIGGVSCGDGKESSQPAIPAPTWRPTITSPSCDAYRPLVSALSALDSKLSIGVLYDEYRIAVQDAQIAYDAVTGTHQEYPCISNVGVPSESALNDYIGALRAWKACIDDGPRCAKATNDEQIQRLWAAASADLDSARRFLNRSGA